MKKIKNTFGIFGHKASRPTIFKNLFGVNQLSALGRDGSYDSYDFVGTIDEVVDYEKRWCTQGSNGFEFLGIEAVKGFKGQFSYCGK